MIHQLVRNNLHLFGQLSTLHIYHIASFPSKSSPENQTMERLLHWKFRQYLSGLNYSYLLNSNPWILSDVAGWNFLCKCDSFQINSQQSYHIILKRQLSVCLVVRVIVKKSSPKNLSVDCRSTVGRHITDSLPTGYRQLTDRLPTVSQRRKLLRKHALNMT